MTHEPWRRPLFLSPGERTGSRLPHFFIGLLLGVLTCTAFVSDEFGRMRQWRCPFPLSSVRHVALLSFETGEWLMAVITPRRMPPAEFLLLFHSTDRGLHWTNPDTLGIFPFAQTTFRAIRTSDGVALGLLTLSRSPSDHGHRGFLYISHDHGKTWAVSRISLGEGVRLRFVSGPFEIEPGHWGILCRTERRGRWLPILLSTQDRGQRWTSHAVGGEWMWDAEEAAVGVDAEGEWTVLFSRRGSPSLSTVRSGDFGKTWHDLNQVAFYGQEGRLIVTRHGTHVAMYRDFTPPSLSLRLSFDRGLTWESEMLLAAFPKDFEGKEIPFALTETEQGISAVWLMPDSREAAFAGVAFFPPPPPRGVSVSSMPYGTTLRWNAVQGCAYYLVFRDTVPHFQPILPPAEKTNLVAMVPTCQYTETPPDTARTLYYRVCGVRGTGRLEPHTGAIGAFSIAVGVSREIPSPRRKSP